MHWLINIACGLFGQAAPLEPSPPPPAAADYKAAQAALEAHIDAAGRDEVFALARANGWSCGMPMWAWHALASEVQLRKLAQEALDG